MGKQYHGSVRRTRPPPWSSALVGEPVRSPTVAVAGGLLPSLAIALPRSGPPPVAFGQAPCCELRTPIGDRLGPYGSLSIRVMTVEAPPLPGTAETSRDAV